jgi:hypothetical protein
VIYTASVAPRTTGQFVPSGSVSFFDASDPIAGCQGEPLGTTAASPQAKCTTSYAGVGSHIIAATYDGDANFSASSSSRRTLTVAVPSPTSNPTPPASGGKPAPTAKAKAAKPSTTATAAGRASVTRVSLRVVGAAHAKLSFNVAQGAHAAAIKVIYVALPGGLRFARNA